MYTEQVTNEDIQNLTDLIPASIEGAKEFHMFQKQQEMEIAMDKKLEDYESKLMKWVDEARNQLQLTYGEDRITGFIKMKKEKEEKKIEAITNESSQYNKDLNGLSQDAYLKLLSVFYNK